MTRQHTTYRRLARRLRPAPERFAAAAALQSPGLLLQLQAADEHAEEDPTDPSPVRGDTGAALLLVAAVALALLSVLTGIALWLALFESGFDPVAATSLCPAR
jgi:hypothetical protein